MLDPSSAWLPVLVAAVALAYSAVGHGGASGYLALLAFAAVASREASTMALVLNLLVSGLAFVLFRRAKHFDAKLVLPFVLGSVPAAFVGGAIRVPDDVFRWLLSLVLAYAAITLLAKAPTSGSQICLPKGPVPVLSGVGIGLLSGIIGVGGGIFLSPLLLLARWANAKQAAAASSVFIFANSASGLAAKASGGLALPPHAPTLALAGVVGALSGAYFGSHRIADRGLRALLGIVLFSAALKLAFR